MEDDVTISSKKQTRSYSCFVVILFLAPSDVICSVPPLNNIVQKAERRLLQVLVAHLGLGDERSQQLLGLRRVIVRHFFCGARQERHENPKFKQLF